MKNGRARWKSIKRMSRDSLGEIVRRATARKKMLDCMVQLDAPPILLDSLYRPMLHDALVAMDLCERRIAMEAGIEYIDPQSGLNQFTARHMRKNGYEVTAAEAIQLRDSAADSIREQMEKKGYVMPRTSIGVSMLMREIMKGKSHALPKRT